MLPVSNVCAWACLIRIETRFFQYFANYDENNQSCMFLIVKDAGEAEKLSNGLFMAADSCEKRIGFLYLEDKFGIFQTSAAG